MNYNKNEIIKLLEDLEVIFNTNIDCSMHPKLCNFSTLLSQTLNKTRLFLEQNQKNKIITPDITTNINYEQLSKCK